MNYRTKAEYFIRGITQGFVEATEVIAWSDEVIVSAAQPEDWMIEISSCGADDRMVVLSHLNTIEGEVDATELAALLKAKGITWLTRCAPLSGKNISSIALTNAAWPSVSARGITTDPLSYAYKI